VGKKEKDFPLYCLLANRLALLRESKHRLENKRMVGITALLKKNGYFCGVD